ncbi:hypothetical protein LEP1GSC071_1841 [Leptospira santarosai str. JET]|uniref:Uncharacterized protein n=1 Tax=Leptospira santarosai serovar Arenal str. MAVJ 401 TaxID=1049976 RepID=M6JPN1_9LEPT|nr:hypothetical protein LEP1GSC071_1841 [Leptospira santarosai str. JET]EMN21543.1 hypothetical protein LEP1GSC063_3974 [Leptospira santarosai serovar Arenal str. MAVJ 401]
MNINKKQDLTGVYLRRTQTRLQVFFTEIVCRNNLEFLLVKMKTKFWDKLLVKSREKRPSLIQVP